MANDDPTILDERRIVALTLFAEAQGGEYDFEYYKVSPVNHQGYDAIASVIHNRMIVAEEFRSRHGMDHPLFGSGSAKEVCLQKYQFSCWNDDDPQRAHLIRMGTSHWEDPLYDLAQVFAGYVIEGWPAGMYDPTDGATHYLTKEAYKQAPPNHWSKSPKMVHTIDLFNHKFFRPA